MSRHIIKYLKHKKLLSIAILSVSAVVLVAGIVYAATSGSATGGGAITQFTNNFGTCNNIQNNNSSALFIPGNTQAEWNAFVSYAPNKVLTSCCTPNSYTACSGGHRYNFDSCNVQGSLAQSCSCGCSSNTCIGTNTYYRDLDGDGYGSAGSGTTAACSAPGGYVANNSDCNDGSSAVYPGAATACVSGTLYNGCSSSSACYSGGCANSTTCSTVTVYGNYLQGKYGASGGSYICSQPSYEDTAVPSSVSLPGGTTYVGGCSIDTANGVGVSPLTPSWNGSSCSAYGRCYGGSPIGQCGYNGYSNYSGCLDGTYTIRVKMDVR